MATATNVAAATALPNAQGATRQALKEHLACGNDAVAVERTPRIGGWFAADDDAAYDTLMLTTSNYFMAYSDAPPPKGEKMRYWTKKEYAAYLEAYAARFDLKPHIEFSTDLVRCAYAGGRWTATTRAGGAVAERSFDAVVACTRAGRVLQFRFNVSFPRARVSETAPTLRERSER